MKYAWVQAYSGYYPVARLCRVLAVSRTGFLQWRQRPPAERHLANTVLDVQVAAIHAESRLKLRTLSVLFATCARGCRVGHERIRRSLCRQGLRPVYKRPYRVTTDSRHNQLLAPHVLARRSDGWQPDRAWVADITYIPTQQGWLYLACVLDLGSRRIVGWSMSERLKAELVCNALKMAYWRRKPAAGLILHSDRGGKSASHEYRALLLDYRMVQPMSRKANCWDNAVMESFFKTLKVERVHRLRYTSRAQARIDLVDWIEGFYNSKRLHSAIDHRSPADFERSLKAA